MPLTADKWHQTAETEWLWVESLYTQRRRRFSTHTLQILSIFISHIVTCSKKEFSSVKMSSSGTLTLHICWQESLWLGAWGQRSSQVTNMVLDSEGWKNNTKEEKQKEVSAGNTDRDKVDTIAGLRCALMATGSKCRLEYEQHIYIEHHIQSADNRHFVEANILQNTWRTERYDPLTHQWEVIWIFRNCRGFPVNNTRTYENKLTLQQVSQSV